PARKLPARRRRRKNNRSRLTARLGRGLLPSPLWGGVGGGGREMWHSIAITSRPPTPTLPHKGGGRRDSTAPPSPRAWDASAPPSHPAPPIPSSRAIPSSAAPTSASMSPAATSHTR